MSSSRRAYPIVRSREYCSSKRSRTPPFPTGCGSPSVGGAPSGASRTSSLVTRAPGAGTTGSAMSDSAVRFICNRRCQQIGIDPLFPNEENPFPWMSEMIDLKKERNFFETRVIEYQTGGALSWE